MTQYVNPTNKPPPIILPIVTGIRLSVMKFITVTPMIKKLVNEKQFIIEVVPEAGDIEKAVFNIDGLYNHIDKVKNACNWN